MSDVESKCPKCQGKMERGFSLDLTHGAALVGHWVQGTPERTALSRFFGKAGGEIVKFDGLQSSIPIGTYRCQSCGYLEAYAREEFRPS